MCLSVSDSVWCVCVCVHLFLCAYVCTCVCKVKRTILGAIPQVPFLFLNLLEKKMLYWPGRHLLVWAEWSMSSKVPIVSSSLVLV